MKRKLLAAPYLLWMVMFIVVPLLMILYYAFTVSEAGDTFLSLRHMEKTLNPIYVTALLKSFLYAGISTVICLVLAYPLAMILAEKKDEGSTMLFIFILPMWMNFLLRTYAWLTLLESNSGFVNVVLRAIGLPGMTIIGTPNAIVLGMVYNFLPFMVLPIYNVLIKIDGQVLEAAHDLGANNFQRLVKVVLPLSLPGIISGITMVFMPAVTSFVIPNLLGSGKVNLIGNLIEQQFLMTYDWGFGAALSFVLMVIILLSMGLLKQFDQELEGGNNLW